jgi:outer membrane protein assembly factor BamD (BamD/ComL family)
MSYLALADIYFEKLNYVTAKAYYDSTVMNLSKKHSRFEDISKLSNDLTELVTHVQTVEREDSLLKVAAMPKGQRDKLIADIIQEIIEEERRLAEEQRQRQMDIAQYNQDNRPGATNASAGGKWYFYNPAAIGVGQADFTRKWGERRLEDNWRRRNKSVTNFDMFAEDGEGMATDSAAEPVDLKSKEYYLSQLPMTDSAKVVAHENIEEALYNMAKVYREQFVDYDKSIEAYLDLLQRYPNTEYKLETAYQLYQLYELQKQSDKSAFYKALILNEYPNSVPAKILTDPNYLAKMEAEKNKTKGFYTKAFDAFQKRDFSKVISYCEHVEKNNPETPLMPKFNLLKAQSIGATGNVDVMKTTLTKLVKDYPETEEQALADFMLARIEAGGFKNFVAEGQTAYQSSNSQNSGSGQNVSNTSGANTDIVEDIEPENIYQYEAEKPHYYLMAATGKISDLNRLKYNIIKYNLDFFLMFDFQVSDRKLTSDTKMIIVKPLNDAKEAYKYLKLIRRNKDVYSEFNTLSMEQFIITEDNLKILQKDKDVARYMMFFNQNYVK